MSYRALKIEDIEGVPWLAGMTWHPVRMELGLHAFGAAGFSAEHPGELVVEPHAESPGGRDHEELYAVLSGRATFTLDGEELDAPVGTLVFVPPTVHRKAIATEPRTTVLALGGPPTFQVAGFEWLMRAKPHMASDPARARAILQDGLAELPGSAAIPYAFALLEATQGDMRSAALSLREALSREPRLRAEAEKEPTLQPLLEPKEGQTPLDKGV
jgi:mannose-6-phosphate isomerase-like protein (cupin superfamily)